MMALILCSSCAAGERYGSSLKNLVEIEGFGQKRKRERSENSVADFEKWRQDGLLAQVSGLLGPWVPDPNGHSNTWIMLSDMGPSPKVGPLFNISHLDPEGRSMQFHKVASLYFSNFSNASKETISYLIINLT